MKRAIYGATSLLLLGIEIIIGLYASGWVRNYLGDVLVVILIYTICRTISPEKPDRWFILPTQSLYLLLWWNSSSCGDSATGSELRINC